MGLFSTFSLLPTPRTCLLPFLIYYVELYAFPTVRGIRQHIPIKYIRSHRLYKLGITS